MKLGLTESKGIHILEISGELEERDLKVLNSGVKGFFKDGKNQLVLSFKEVAKTPFTFPKEMLVLSLLANELSGMIVFSGLPSDDEKKLLSIDKKGIIKTAKSLPQALSMFGPQVKAEETDSKTPSGDTSPSELLEEIEFLKTENNRLLAALEMEEKGTDAGQLRVENTQLKEQIKIMSDKIEQLSTPQGENQTALQALEQQVQDLTSQMQASKS